jgi:hypothetical protein
MLQVYKAVLLHQYGTAILVFLAVLFINVFQSSLSSLQVGQGELPAPSIESVDEELD